MQFFGRDLLQEKTSEGRVPAAVAFPVRILTCVSSSDILLCASSATPGCACDKSAPHLSHLCVNSGAVVNGFMSTVVIEDIYRNLRIWRFPKRAEEVLGLHCIAIGATTAIR